MSPEIKAVIDAATLHAENQRLLDLYLTNKRARLDEISDLNIQIQAARDAVTLSKAALKTAVTNL